MKTCSGPADASLTRSEAGPPDWYGSYEFTKVGTALNAKLLLQIHCFAQRAVISNGRT